MVRHIFAILHYSNPYQSILLSLLLCDIERGTDDKERGTRHHEPLEFPALCPADAPLMLPSMAHAPEVLDDVAPVLALCPSVVPLEFSLFLNTDHSVRSWLISALPLALAPFFAQALAVPVSPVLAPVVPSVTEAAPVVKKTRKPKSTKEKAQDETPRKRSPKTAAAAQ